MSEPGPLRPGDLVRETVTGEVVVFLGWEAGGAEPRFARCQHAGGRVELYEPEQLERHPPA